MRRFKLELCYDGTEYSGWQRQPAQPEVRTVQGELERATAEIIREQVSISGSGRTDAGVHALCQVAAFSCETSLSPEILTKAINAQLPSDIRIWRTTEVPMEFHPLKNIARKRYRYLMSDTRPFFPFFRNHVWFSLKKLDLAAMRQAADYLSGRHDFSAFETVGSPRKTSVRTIFDVRLDRIPACFPWVIPVREREKDNSSDGRMPSVSGPFFPETSFIVLEVEADGFLYNMVRAIAGTLSLFGGRRKGFEDPKNMQAIIESCDRDQAGPTAPPFGLYMIDVQYNPISTTGGLSTTAGKDDSCDFPT